MNKIDLEFFIQDYSTNVDLIQIRISRVKGVTTLRTGTALTFIIIGLGFQLIILD
jgi:hypothetical protein